MPPEGDPTYNGYYTWPRLGYDAALKNHERNALPAKLQGARTLADLMTTAEGRAWWKQNGSGRDMFFDLKARSRSRRTLSRYLRVKGIKL